MFTITENSRTIELEFFEVGWEGWYMNAPGWSGNSEALRIRGEAANILSYLRDKQGAEVEAKVLLANSLESKRTQFAFTLIEIDITMDHIKYRVSDGESIKFIKLPILMSQLLGSDNKLWFGWY